MGVYDGTKAYLYVNGGLAASLAVGSLNQATNDPFLIGAKINSTGGQATHWAGGIDEVRYSNSARTADWITTEYNNQSNPGNFYALGTESGVTIASTITTFPAGLGITVDGTSYTAPQTFQWTAGASHTIAVSSPISGGTGIQYLFGSWSDSGAQSHSITVPSSATTYTANFTTQYQLTTIENPPAGGGISPASGGWYNAGTVVSVSAKSDFGYQFTGFSGALTGTMSPQNLTMNSASSVTANFSATTVNTTITTLPAGLAITVDGTNYTAPQTFQWTAGASHNIAVSSPLSGGTGTQYAFASWSDSGTQSHSITVPSSATTYTANFTTQYQLTTLASPAADGGISPASGGWYNAGTVVSVSATANGGYQFTGFTGALTGATTPQNLTLNAAASVTANFATSSGSNGYNYSRSITIADGQVPSTQTNFPVLFNSTDPLLKTTANGGHVTNANGYDIIFTSDAAGAQPLPFEIESYSGSTGTLIAWVQVPTLSSATNTVIYLFYGNSSITTSQANQTAVWDSNFKGVWHLPNGTTSSAA